MGEQEAESKGELKGKGKGWSIAWRARSPQRCLLAPFLPLSCQTDRDIDRPSLLPSPLPSDANELSPLDSTLDASRIHHGSSGFPTVDSRILHNL